MALMRRLGSYLWSATEVVGGAALLFVALNLFFGSSDPDAAVNDEHRAAIELQVEGEWYASIALYEAALAKAPVNPKILQDLFVIHAKLDHRLPAALYECAYLEAGGKSGESAATLAAASRALFRTADDLYGQAIALAKSSGADKGGVRQAHLVSERGKAIPAHDTFDAVSAHCLDMVSVSPVIPCADDPRRSCGKLDLRDPKLIDPELIAGVLRGLPPVDAGEALAKLAAKLAAVAAFLKMRVATG
jgi:hypothetical protein